MESYFVLSDFQIHQMYENDSSKISHLGLGFTLGLQAAESEVCISLKIRVDTLTCTTSRNNRVPEKFMW
jgi:hypothetical protein